MSRKILFEKKGKKAKVQRNPQYRFEDSVLKRKAVLKIEWSDEEGYITDITERNGNKIISLENIKFRGEQLDGMRIDKETAKELKELKQEIKNEEKKKAKKQTTVLKVEESEYGSGWKTTVKTFNYDARTVDKEEREKLGEIEEILGREKIRGTGIDGINAEKFDTGQRFTVDELYNELKKDIQEKQKQKKQRQEEKEQKKQKALKKAKETGEPQTIKTVRDDCNDPSEECDLDLIATKAMPSGEIETERTHTW